MELVHVTVTPGPPFEVGDFGPDVERSAKGAIYFRPRRLRRITPGELAHIRAAHPDEAGRLVEVGRSGAPRSAPITLPATPPYPPPQYSTPASVAEDDKKGEDPSGDACEKPDGGEESGAGEESVAGEKSDAGDPGGEEKPRKRRSRKRQK